jgi:phage terminase Nu1 subunit (DNA packaging protein)
MSTPAYPVSTIAKLFNLTERRVQQLASDGVIPKSTRGKYDLVASVRGYISFLQDRAFGKDIAPVDAHNERTRLLKAQADKTELEVKTITGELIPAADIEAEWASLVVAFRSRMLVLPTRGAHQICGLQDSRNIEQALKELVYEALNELSLYEPQENTKLDLQSGQTRCATTLHDGESVGR